MCHRFHRFHFDSEPRFRIISGTNSGRVPSLWIDLLVAYHPNDDNMMKIQKQLNALTDQQISSRRSRIQNNREKRLPSYCSSSSWFSVCLCSSPRRWIERSVDLSSLLVLGRFYTCYSLASLRDEVVVCMGWLCCNRTKSRSKSRWQPYPLVDSSSWMLRSAP